MSNPHDAVSAVWREQAPRLVGGLLRMTGDPDLAEDFAHDAMVAALEQWPAAGVPANPAAWLMAVAKRRAVDHLRRTERLGQVHARIAQDLRTQHWEEEQVPDPVAAVDHVEDDVLRLMLMTCHPALSSESQVALTLRLLGGLTTREIARAFLVPEGTVTRRISRAKATLSEVARQPGDAPSPFELPAPHERCRRLPAVLHVLYLVFTEGYAATVGEDWLRPALCDEAIRLGHLVAGLFPNEPEVHGLLALMWLQASRTPARTNHAGDPVLLEDQDRGRWDQPAIRRGTEALGRALAGGPPGPYTLQAAIAACHASATSVQDTDWATIADLYDALAARAGSPVVLLNRAVAHTMAHGADSGLRLLDELAGTPGLREHHLLPSVRGDLLCRLGRREEARLEFERAAALAGNARERTVLLARARRT